MRVLAASAYWRITVTNQGPVGITSAQVVDTVEPTCQTGPFTLAAGQSDGQSGFENARCSFTVGNAKAVRAHGTLYESGVGSVSSVEAK